MNLFLGAIEARPRASAAVAAVRPLQARPSRHISRVSASSSTNEAVPLTWPPGRQQLESERRARGVVQGQLPAHGPRQAIGSPRPRPWVLVLSSGSKSAARGIEGRSSSHTRTTAPLDGQPGQQYSPAPVAERDQLLSRRFSRIVRTYVGSALAWMAPRTPRARRAVPAASGPRSSASVRTIASSAICWRSGSPRSNGSQGLQWERAVGCAGRVRGRRGGRRRA